MNTAFTDIFVKRPVLSIVVSLIIVLAGLQAISSLTVRQYPRNENAKVTITTFYIGADADLVRGFITTPLERSVATADGINYISSESKLGMSTITVRLELNYDSTKALAEISSKVDQVRGDLPPEAEIPIISVQSADSEFASAYLSFSSDILEANEITDYLVRVIQPRLTAINGVKEAEILGGRTYAMRIWLDPARMASLGIYPAQVREALASNNYLSAVGQTKGNLVTVNLTTNTDLNTVEDFEQLAILNQGDTIVRIKDIATVELGGEDYNAEVRFSGKKAVFMGMFVLPNANTVDVISDVRTELEAIKKELPVGVIADMAYDSTVYIEQSISEVVKTLMETLAIVMFVIFLFMGRIRTVLVPIITIPISLIGAVFLMQMFGFSINLLTLLAVVLSVGIVVDDAIIVVENIERHLEAGMESKQAALLGVRELIGPVIATTLVLVAVYVPIAFQGGLTGSLFREFALTLTGAVVVSTIVALTLSPMLSSKVLKSGKHTGLALLINNGFDRLRKTYGRILRVALQTRWVTYLAWIVLTLCCAPMFMLSPKELAPTEDQGVIFGIVDAPANYAIEETSRFADAANDVFFSFPETDYTFQLTFPNAGFSGMLLSPWNERERTTLDIVPEAMMGLGQISGINIFPVAPPALPGGSQFPVDFIVASTAEPEQILEFANKIYAKAMASGTFAFLVIDTKIDQPQTKFVIDRDLVSSLGLDQRDIGADLGSLVGGAYVNRFNIGGRSYKVIPQIKRSERLNPEQLEDIYVKGPDGQLIQLSTVATLEESVQPRALNRFQQFNSVKMSGVYIGGPLDQGLKFLEDTAAEILPDGYRVDYDGESRQLRTEGNKFLPAFSLAIVLIFLVLSAQFNSFRDPFIILLGSVPLAMFGALIFTFLKMMDPNLPHWTSAWTTTLNIYSQVGLVTLIGLVAKNGILIVEFANQLQREGRSKLDAIQEAAEVRLRPILMTTVATVAGHFPLTLVTGAGAEARNSIGLVLVGGMAIGTIFTVLFLPSIYMLIAKDRSKEAAESASN
ncbi:MAG: efflux RND transporter permease subunit [Opitutales bacterium]|jgi:multidrug efflux pump|nr:efflux RND transporter permease subunit [Opitutales bacterium]MDP4643826.1 efflux RND transporter permease subunit [Opitutales bacterium]MDP4776538.1 efflux RND transporter permease subunit [Opitutales bacterium]MDP4884414.1 efflux RND transporter permease subunit [Opitutales bacterium]MDP5079334.1 efflux RND transporter permease subunit [Opitutales bacterium]